MAMTPEGRVKHAVKKQLDALNCWYFSPQSGIYGRSGIPDIIGCFKGRFFAIECKAGKGVTTALQEREIEEIRDARGVVFVVYEQDVPTLSAKLIMEVAA